MAEGLQTKFLEIRQGDLHAEHIVDPQKIKDLEGCTEGEQDMDIQHRDLDVLEHELLELRDKKFINLGDIAIGKVEDSQRWHETEHGLRQPAPGLRQRAPNHRREMEDLEAI